MSDLEQRQREVREAARQKRAQARDEKIEAGLLGLEARLEELAARGLGDPELAAYASWDQLAARLVDAQLPGLARRLRRIGGLIGAGAGGLERALDELARVHLAVRAHRHRAALSVEEAADLEATLGAAVRQAEVLEGPASREAFLAIGRRVDEEDGLWRGLTWLLGLSSGRVAALIDYAPAEEALPPALIIGAARDLELCFYPSAWPERALVKADHGEAPLALEAALRRFYSPRGVARVLADALARSPFVERVGVGLATVVPVLHRGRWLLREASGEALPLRESAPLVPWILAARSGGHPLAVFGEWDGHGFAPLSVVGPDAVSALPSWRFVAAADQAPSALGRRVAHAMLLGTGRSTEPLAAAGALGALLEGARARGGGLEGALLDGLAAVRVHLAAGASPERPESDPPRLAPSDRRPPPSDRAAALLVGLLERSRHDEVLREGLGLLADGGLRLRHQDVPLFLELARTQAAWRDRVSAVLGERGRWLAAQNPAWSFAARPLAATTLEELEAEWRDGDLAGRVRALLAARRHDPAAARARVEAVWREEQAAARAALLGAFAVGLGSEDEAFLERALGDRAKEVRRNAAELLAQLPGSGFVARMAARAEPCLAYERGGLLRRAALRVTPPAQLDPAAVRDGLDPARGRVDRARWLEQILAAVPPGRWSAAFQLEPGALIRLAEASEWGHALLTGFSRAALRHRDEAWALALLEEEAPDAALLWAVPSPKAREAAFARRLSPDRREDQVRDALYRLTQLPGPFSPAFSAELVECLARVARSPLGDFPARSITRDAALKLDPSAAPAVEGLLAAVPQASYWAEALSEAVELLQLRATLHQALAAPETTER